MYRCRLLFVFLLLAPLGPLIAAEPALQACFACHGEDGMGKADPMIPVIAGAPIFSPARLTIACAPSASDPQPAALRPSQASTLTPDG